MSKQVLHQTKEWKMLSNVHFESGIVQQSAVRDSISPGGLQNQGYTM